MVNEHTMDIVYVVRPGDDNDALRYSLRSIEKNLPHRNVIISGYCPKWVNTNLVTYVERNQEEFPELSNTNYNLLAVIENIQGLSDNFILMNDDFIVFEPYTPENNHQGPLNDVIERYKKTVLLQAYSLKKTSMYLVQLGVMPPYYSYELHTPFVYNKVMLLDLFRKLTGPEPYRNPHVDMFTIRPRTLYGNYFKIGGKEIADVKQDQPLRPLWSAPSGALRAGQGSRRSGAAIEARTPESICRGAFPERSRYEATVSSSVQEQDKRANTHDYQRHSSSSHGQQQKHGAS